MNYVEENTYLQARLRRIKLYSRIRLGGHLLIFRPYTIIVPFLLIFLFSKLGKYKWVLFSFNVVPSQLLTIYQNTISFATILIPIVFFFGYLKFLGDVSARQDEANITVAFTAKDLRNGYPILTTRYKVKGADITIREFYSPIPLKIWKDRKEELADQMNVHFVEPAITYGGKRNNNGNRIRLYTAPGKNQIDRGKLYDDEL